MKKILIILLSIIILCGCIGCEKENKLTKENKIDYQLYSKIIDDIKIDLNIPNNWHYQEMPVDKETYKYALKIYKQNENEYATLYINNQPFGVCGTGRTTKKIILNNKKEATIGYYDNDKNWSDISFFNINKYISIINNGLKDDDAEYFIEFIKTIDIKESGK